MRVGTISRLTQVFFRCVGDINYLLELCCSTTCEFVGGWVNRNVVESRYVNLEAGFYFLKSFIKSVAGPCD